MLQPKVRLIFTKFFLFLLSNLNDVRHNNLEAPDDLILSGRYPAESFQYEDGAQECKESLTGGEEPCCDGPGREQRLCVNQEHSC